MHFSEFSFDAFPLLVLESDLLVLHLLPSVVHPRLSAYIYLCVVIPLLCASNPLLIKKATNHPNVVTYKQIHNNEGK